jgi:RsiW-degrading membrane proteinase PrsW (M82 family)
MQIMTLGCMAHELLDYFRRYGCRRLFVAEWGYKMVSTWWLLLTFLAGGYAGVLLCALLNVSRDTSDDLHPLIPRRRGSPRPAVKEGTLTGGEA